MKVRLLTVGNRMPAWVETGCQDYLKRFGNWLNLSVIEIAPARRQKNDSAADQQRYRQQEGESILNHIHANDFVIALEVEGNAWSTTELVLQMQKWALNGKNIALIIGGPDGLSNAVRKRANQQWSLSNLTLPHPIARLMLIEQLYRAASINHGHPYHRD